MPPQASEHTASEPRGTQSLDLDFVRSQFPAFSEPSLHGWAFFENAGGSYACGPVIERLDRYYRETKVQPYGNYPASMRAGAEMDEAYSRLAGYLNVGEHEVHFGPSTSQNTYILAQAFRGILAAGDEIIVTNQDHEANSGSWRRLAEVRLRTPMPTGVVVREWRIDPETGMLKLDDLDALLTDRTRLVAFPHASNVVAHENPVAEIVARAHAFGAWAIVDGVAAAPHGLPDVSALGADVYLFSLYKTYGPHQGLMVVRTPLLEALPNQGHFFNAEVARKKLIPAGPDHAQIAAAAGIADYLDAVYAHHFVDAADAAERGRRIHTLFRTAEQARVAPLLDWLSHRDGVRLIGPADPILRMPTVAITSRNHPAPWLARQLAEHGIMAGSGHYYAARVLMGMGIPLDPGVLRMSFVHYTNDDEVARLIEALDQIL
ncbi:MAG: aminotransferase class V-fold PLP-dependent enzyme [Anaerolineae bacterium]|jgi:selenocysteine lyase/cysteine desulfurase|nr:aminotransferase class V-fold PLP-dependent enzyme [Anaerolineae bacterium]